MSPRLALSLLLALHAPGCARPSTTGVTPGETNVLFVIIDTLRADRLGAWGYRHGTSPHLDRLAAEGVVFENAFANSSWTRPSIASLLTGLPPRTTGIFEEQFDRLVPELTTLAERFEQAGYVTLGLTSNPNINGYFGFQQGFTEWGDSRGFPWMRDELDEGARQTERKTYDDARAVTERALDMVTRHEDRLRDRPFYLQVLYVDPHDPYAPPAEHLEAVQRAGAKTPRYDGEVRYVDAELARLLDGLRERGLLEDTLVVVTSDHGEGLGSHHNLPGSPVHGYTLYDSVTHVPLVFWHADMEAARVPALVQLLDVAPTLVDMLALPALARMPGASLVPYFADPGREATIDVVVSETDWRFVRAISARTETHRYVRNDAAKLFRDEGVYETAEPREDVARYLRAYPDEGLYRRALAGAGGLEIVFEHPFVNTVDEERELAERLGAYLRAWEKQTESRAPVNRSAEDVVTLPDGTTVQDPEATGAEELDPEVRRQLEGLGYLGGG